VTAVVLDAPVELGHVHAGQTELVAEAFNWTRDHAQVLGDERQLAKRRGDRIEERPSGAAPPRAQTRGLVSLGHRPVGDEAAEVVDSHEIEELERPPQALDPPAVAGRPHCPPVVERGSPALASAAEVIGWNARDHTLLEEL